MKTDKADKGKSEVGMKEPFGYNVTPHMMPLLPFFGTPRRHDRHAGKGYPSVPSGSSAVNLPTSAFGRVIKKCLSFLSLSGYNYPMNAIEFTTELNDSRILQIPQEAAVRLPKTGRARIIILADDSKSDSDWQLSAYQQFLRDDAQEDAIYDSLL